MTVLVALLFAAVVINAVFTILIYSLLRDLLSITEVRQATSYKEAVGRQRTPMLAFKKEAAKGHAVTKTEELVDIADIPWEDGYKAMEDIHG